MNPTPRVLKPERAKLTRLKMSDKSILQKSAKIGRASVRKLRGTVSGFGGSI
jgi:hypothetical protein